MKRESSLLRIGSLILISAVVGLSLPATSVAVTALQSMPGQSRSELGANLHVTKQVIYSQRLDDLSAGELLGLALDGQVTNHWDVFAGWSLSSPYFSTLDVQTSAVLASSPTDTVGLKTVVPAATDSITAQAHHGLVARHLVWQVDQNYPGSMYINWVAQTFTETGPNGADLDANPTTQNDYARLDSPYGRFHVERLGNPNVSGSSARNVQRASTSTPLRSSIPVDPCQGPQTFFELPVKLRGGDSLQALGELRLDNPLTSTLILQSSLTIAKPNGSETVLSDNPGEYLAGYTGNGAAQDRYHVVPHASSYTVPSGSPTGTYRLRLKAVAQQPNQSCGTSPGVSPTLQSGGGGQISALIFRSGSPTIPLHTAPTSAGVTAPLVIPELDGDDFTSGSIAGRGTTTDGTPYVRVTNGAISTPPLSLGAGTGRVLAIEAMPERRATVAPGYCADPASGYPSKSSGEGAPYMRVSFGGQVVAEQVVRRGGTADDYVFANLPARLSGTGSLAVEVTNPYTDPVTGCSRGLRIRRVRILGSGGEAYRATGAKAYTDLPEHGAVVNVPYQAGPGPIAAVTIPHVDANDVLDVTLSTDAVNTSGPEIEFGTQIDLLDSAGATLATITPPETAENMLPSPWRTFQSRHGVWVAPQTWSYSGPVTVRAQAWSSGNPTTASVGAAAPALSVMDYAR
jgi:hypothetical protein